jgi:hypothetical protein
MNIEQTINEFKAKPILFKPDMGKAILEGRKNETRRTRGLKEINKNPDDWEFINIKNGIATFWDKTYSDLPFPIEENIKCPYGEPGDYLWVRETWREEFFTVDHTQRYDHKYYYKSDNKRFYSSYGEEKIFKWKSSIYMPKSACRLILKIEDLGIERIQDIDSVSAINEGIEFEFDTYRNYLMQNKTGSFVFGNPIDSFKSLFISINGQESWDKHIFVWRIKFSKCIKI